MTRTLLVNALVPEALRVAIVEGSTLEHYQIDTAQKGLTRGNIYRGTISNIQPSLNAAFIDYGAERNGFLAIQDVVEAAYYGKPENAQRPRIDEVLETGKPIVVQVVKEAVGEKGAALTTNLSLAGRYLVLTPFSSTRGVSRKVEDGETRARLKEVVSQLVLPPDAGAIVRTNALEQSKTTLQRDLNALLRLWQRVGESAIEGDELSKLLYSDQDLVLQTLRDYLDSSIDEVLIDDDPAFQKAQEYRRAFMPRSKTRIARYLDRRPLFDRHNLEAQIACIYDRKVPLPSGGSLVIDPTEALTAIDINSGRSTSASTQEETALNTNLESAAEVGRQLRLRDIGGLVVVDFIDMRMFKNRRAVEKAMRAALKSDKARATVGRISANGLLEINRQRIQQAIHFRTHQECPTCGGAGRVFSAALVASKMLRELETKVAKGSIRKATVTLQRDACQQIQNNNRAELARMEAEYQTAIEIAGSDTLKPDEYEFAWQRRDPAELSRQRGAQPQRPAEQKKSRSSRSRRGSGKNSGSQTEKKKKKSATSKSASKTASKATSKAAPETAADASAETKPSRPRRRRSSQSRTARSAAAAPEAAATAVTAESSSAAEGETKAAKPRRRRAPRRKPAASAATTAADASGDGNASDTATKEAPTKSSSRSRKPRAAAASSVTTPAVTTPTATTPPPPAPAVPTPVKSKVAKPTPAPPIPATPAAPASAAKAKPSQSAAKEVSKEPDSAKPDSAKKAEKSFVPKTPPLS